MGDCRPPFVSSLRLPPSPTVTAATIGEIGLNYGLLIDWSRTMAATVPALASFRIRYNLGSWLPVTRVSWVSVTRLYVAAEELVLHGSIEVELLNMDPLLAAADGAIARPFYASDGV